MRLARDSTTDSRTTEQGNTFDSALIRDFIHAALAHDAALDQVLDLLHDHVAHGRYHRTVVAASLKPILEEIISAATDDDWRLITDQLVAEACDCIPQ